MVRKAIAIVVEVEMKDLMKMGYFVHKYQVMFELNIDVSKCYLLSTVIKIFDLYIVKD